MAFRLPPAPAAMIASPRNDSDVRFIHTFGLPWMMTRSPCTNGAGRGGEPAEAIDFHGDILEVVAQRDVGRAGATGIDLRDLAGDPRGRPSFHGTVELLAQHAYRPRILRGGFSGACRQLIDRARLIRQIDGAPIGRESALTRLKASRGQ